MQCEICGKPGATTRIEMDGIEMIACGQCSRFGTIIEEKKQQPARQLTQNPKKIFTGQQQKFEQLILVDCFEKAIKSAREKRQLTFEDLSRIVGEKTSVLRSIESGHLQPTMETAKRLEKTLGIRIIESSVGALEQ